MKKQILLLLFLMLATLFAGLNKSYAQNTEEDYLTVAPTYCVPAVPLTCAQGDALHPAPGVSYDYTITVSGSPSEVYWFVTDDNNIMTAANTFTTAIDPGDGLGDYLLTSDGVYNNTSNTATTISLTWKSFDGVANDVVLVAYALDAAGCTDNIEVYRIEPKPSFTLDIAGLLDDGTSGNTECVAPVQSATYDGTTLTVDYGMNYVYYTVNAANWQTSWMPDNFSAITNGGSTVGTPEWAYPDEATTGGTWHATDGTEEVLASHYASNDNGFIGSAGECIVVRVPVDHASTTENIVDETINLTVNGEMVNPETNAYDGVYPDLDEGTPDCISDLTTDNADYIITARPDINESDPTPFEDKTPED